MKEGFTKVTPEIMNELCVVTHHCNIIFDIGMSDDKKEITMREGCDKYFDVEMSKKQFGILIHQMTKIHADMN